MWNKLAAPDSQSRNIETTVDLQTRHRASPPAMDSPEWVCCLHLPPSDKEKFPEGCREASEKNGRLRKSERAERDLANMRKVRTEACSDLAGDIVGGIREETPPVRRSSLVDLMTARSIFGSQVRKIKISDQEACQFEAYRSLRDRVEDREEYREIIYLFPSCQLSNRSPARDS